MIQSSGHTDPNDNARPNPKNISPPVQCKTCTGQFYKFEAKGHPDDGEVFACSIMLENMRENGNKPFACSYREAPAQAPIIDAEAKPGCFGAFGYQTCISRVGPCVWVNRCKQSQEDY